MEDFIKFQKSITKELEVVKDRVRNLIGSRHWAEEGRYKEEIISRAIQNQLPSHISVGTGFIIKKINPHQHIYSKQIDILIYDNRFPLIMKYGNFIITTPKHTLGVIEVKSNISPSSFKTTFNKLETSLEEIFDEPNKKFIGIFSYNFKKRNGDNYSVTQEGEVAETLRKSKGIVNHIALNENEFIKFWENEEGTQLVNPILTNRNFYNSYSIENLSFSYFISNIVHRLCADIEELYWLSFPIINTKEEHRKLTIEIRS